MKNKDVQMAIIWDLRFPRTFNTSANWGPPVHLDGARLRQQQQRDWKSAHASNIDHCCAVSSGCLPLATCQANTHVRTLKCANTNSNPDTHSPPTTPIPLFYPLSPTPLPVPLLRRVNKKHGHLERGWLQEMKTCLIFTATNDDAALHTPCPLIGLWLSLHLEMPCHSL